ncbi:MAG: hypothetical protein IJD09_02525, partial [Clostridia bacterium]|nr:hypothetical protein [Clostridia bacterium]
STPSTPTTPSDPVEPEEPDNSQPEPEQPTPDPGANVTYKQYLSMTAKQKSEFFKSFPSAAAFNEWKTAAKAAYDAANSGNVVTGGGSIDLGDYIK